MKNRQKLDSEIRAEKCKIDLVEREKQITRREKELNKLENEMKQRIAKVKSDRVQIKEWSDHYKTERGKVDKARDGRNFKSRICDKL